MQYQSECTLTLPSGYVNADVAAPVPIPMGGSTIPSDSYESISATGVSGNNVINVARITTLVSRTVSPMRPTEHSTSASVSGNVPSIAGAAGDELRSILMTCKERMDMKPSVLWIGESYASD